MEWLIFAALKDLNGRIRGWKIWSKLKNVEFGADDTSYRHVLHVRSYPSMDGASALYDKYYVV